MKKKKGFTLIELIIVIVILGIIAAYAVPKYLSLGREARKSVTLALAGTLKSAANMVENIASVQNKDVGHDTVDMGNGIIVDTWSGYPEAKKGDRGILAVIQDISDNFTISEGTIMELGKGLIFFAKGAKDPSSCVVLYYIGIDEDTEQVKMYSKSMVDGC